MIAVLGGGTNRNEWEREIVDLSSAYQQKLFAT